MNRREVERLVEMGGACGKLIPCVSRKGEQIERRCLLTPGHDGAHKEEFAKRRPTTEERLLRRLAKKSALAEDRDRSEEHLRRLLRRHQEKIERIESYPLYRLEYRLRGIGFRLRRYYRLVRSRSPMQNKPPKTP